MLRYMNLAQVAKQNEKRSCVSGLPPFQTFFQGPFVMKLSFGLIPKMQDSEFFSNLSYRHHCISPLHFRMHYRRD